MSSFTVKTKYYTEGGYGSEDENYLYATHNNSCDIVTFYDEKGDWLFSVPDTMNNNILDAINKLYSPRTLDGKYKEDIERVDYEEKNKLGI